MEIKQSFSTSEVAKYCHVTADTIRKWAEAGRITVFKTPGGHRRIRREDLVQFLRENSIPVHGDLNAAGVRILLIDWSAPLRKWYAVCSNAHAPLSMLNRHMTHSMRGAWSLRSSRMSSLWICASQASIRSKSCAG